VLLELEGHGCFYTSICFTKHQVWKNMEEPELVAVFVIYCLTKYWFHKPKEKTKFTNFTNNYFLILNFKYVCAKAKF
jgi:hypothetical protein